VQVEDGLPSARTDADDDAVVVEACRARRVGHELEHLLRLVGRKLGYIPEGLDVTLGDDQQVRFRLGVDVANGDEAFRAMDVLAVAEEAAEEAFLRQRGSPPA
jgi:hypothetical protein